MGRARQAARPGRRLLSPNPNPNSNPNPNPHPNPNRPNPNPNPDPDQADAISGGQVELLALFSNPRLAPTTRGGFFQGALPPLRLGLELKALLRAVPPVHLAIEPAASIDDVVEVLSKHHQP